MLKCNYGLCIVLFLISWFWLNWYVLVAVASCYSYLFRLCCRYCWFVGFTIMFVIFFVYVFNCVHFSLFFCWCLSCALIVIVCWAFSFFCWLFVLLDLLGWFSCIVIDVPIWLFGCWVFVLLLNLGIWLLIRNCLLICDCLAFVFVIWVLCFGVFYFEFAWLSCVWCVVCFPTCVRCGLLLTCFAIGWWCPCSVVNWMFDLVIVGLFGYSCYFILGLIVICCFVYVGLQLCWFLLLWIVTLLFRCWLPAFVCCFDVVLVF